jgi:hypothetical protein
LAVSATVRSIQTFYVGLNAYTKGASDRVRGSVLARRTFWCPKS